MHDNELQIKMERSYCVHQCESRANPKYDLFHLIQYIIASPPAFHVLQLVNGNTEQTSPIKLLWQLFWLLPNLSPPTLPQKTNKQVKETELMACH